MKAFLRNICIMLVACLISLFALGNGYKNEQTNLTNVPSKEMTETVSVVLEKESDIVSSIPNKVHKSRIPPRNYLIYEPEEYKEVDWEVVFKGSKENVTVFETTENKVASEKNEEVEEAEKAEENYSEEENKSLGTFTLTAYCACSSCCGKSDGITATGTIATQGRTIAVDPRVIPYGTRVMINGNIYVAEDCGGAIGGNRIDVFFNSHQDALYFGVQKAEVFLVD